MARGRRPFGRRRGPGRPTRGYRKKPSRPRIRSTPRIASTSGSIVLNTFRRLLLGPSTLNTTTGSPVPMWLATLLPVLVTAMKVVSQVIRTAVSVPFRGTTVLATEFIQLGGATVLAFGIEDLILNSPLVFRRNPTPTTPSTAINICPYREGLIEWVKVIITPAAAVANRKGQFAVALGPISTEAEATNLFANRGGDIDFDCILAMPGGRVFPADKAFAVTYVPRTSEIQRLWSVIGSNNKGDPHVWGAGAWPQLKLCIHYYDLASRKDDLESQYSDSQATFDLTFSARVRLRNANDMDEAVLNPDTVDARMRNQFLKLVDTDTITLKTSGGRIEVPSSRLFSHAGRFFIHDEDADVLDALASPMSS